MCCVSFHLDGRKKHFEFFLNFVCRKEKIDKIDKKSGESYQGREKVGKI